MKTHIQKFLKDESGQALSEYALILALIAVVVIGAVSLFGERVQETFTNIANAIGGGSASS